MAGKTIFSDQSGCAACACVSVCVMYLFCLISRPQPRPQHGQLEAPYIYGLLLVVSARVEDENIRLFGCAPAGPRFAF